MKKTLSLVFLILASVIVLGFEIAAHERVMHESPYQMSQALMPTKPMCENDREKLMGTEFALNDYVQSHKGQFPDASRWEDELAKYLIKWSVRNVSLIDLPGEAARRLAMNDRFSRASFPDSQDMESDDAKNVIFYETYSTQKNAHGKPTNDIILDGPGGRQFAFIYADGHMYP